jgi:hypothetical protein
MQRSPREPGRLGRGGDPRWPERTSGGSRYRGWAWGALTGRGMICGRHTDHFAGVWSKGEGQGGRVRL